LSPPQTSIAVNDLHRGFDAHVGMHQQTPQIIEHGLVHGAFTTALLSWSKKWSWSFQTHVEQTCCVVLSLSFLKKKIREGP
jgi:ribosome-associated toxin RatA of RatAB toxin-antitoxin module